MCMPKASIKQSNVVLQKERAHTHAQHTHTTTHTRRWGVSHRFSRVHDRQQPASPHSSIATRLQATRSNQPLKGACTSETFEACEWEQVNTQTAQGVVMGTYSSAVAMVLQHPVHVEAHHLDSNVPVLEHLTPLKPRHVPALVRPARVLVLDLDLGCVNHTQRQPMPHSVRHSREHGHTTQQLPTPCNARRP
mgnify:CR=1 FL=1